MEKKKTLPKFEPAICEHCKQTTEYALSLDRGTAMIVLAVYNRVRIKDKNNVHLRDEMEVGSKAYSDYREMVTDGHITSRMIDNVLRAKYHGLLAQVDGGGRGEYLITRKGAAFLRDVPLDRVAIIDKATHTKKCYWNPGEDMVTFAELMKKETPFWKIEPFDVEEATGTFREVDSQSPTLF